MANKVLILEPIPPTLNRAKSDKVTDWAKVFANEVLRRIFGRRS